MASSPARIRRAQPIVIEVVDRPIQGAEPVQVTLVDQPVPAENRPVLVRYQEDLVSRPSQVIIARSGQPYQDNSGPLPQSLSARRHLMTVQRTTPCRPDS